MKEIKELNKWKNVSCSQIGRLNIVKISVFDISMLIYRFNIILIKIPAGYFEHNNKMTVKFTRKSLRLKRKASAETIKEKTWQQKRKEPPTLAKFSIVLSKSNFLFDIIDGIRQKQDL